LPYLVKRTLLHTTVKACPHWQQIVAENGNKLLPEFVARICCRFRQHFVAVSGNNLLPKMSTKLYCPRWQQFVAEIGNKLLPVASVDRPLASPYNQAFLRRRCYSVEQLAVRHSKSNCFVFNYI